MSWQTVDSLGELGNSGWKTLEDTISHFEQSWRSGASPELHQFVPDGDESFRARSLIELIKVDIEYQIRNGHERPLESYLDAWPELQTPETTVELLQAECLSRTIFSTPPTHEEMERRFGDLAGLIDLDTIEIEAAEQRGELWERPPSQPLQDTHWTRRPTWRPLPIGYCVGRYEILNVVGAGGMAWVYRAHDHVLNRDIALKVPRFGDKDCLHRFVQEGQAAAAIEHPNVCRIYDAGEADGVAYITMALIDGVTLNERLEAGPLQPWEAVEIVRKIAAALAVIHDKGIVHRDVKASNIMIDPAGEPILMDFGLARSEVQFESLSRTGSFLGSLPYVSPEQARGESVDSRTDIYSLGVILFQLLTGQIPFDSLTAENLGKNHETTLRNPANWIAEQDPVLDGICQLAMAKDREDRFQSAEQMADALDRHLKGQPQVIQPRSGTDTKKKWIAGVGGMILVLFPIIAYILWALLMGTSETIRWIETDRMVAAATLSSDESRLYVALGGDSDGCPIYEMDFKTEKILDEIRFPDNHAHHDIVLTPDDRYLFTTNYYFNYLSRIDLKGNRTPKSIRITSLEKEEDKSWRWAKDFVLTPDGKKLVIPMGRDGRSADEHNDQVAIVDISSKEPELQQEVPLDDEPTGHGIGILEDSQYAYIVTRPRPSNDDPKLYEVELHSPYRVRAMPFPDGQLKSVAVSNRFGKLYVSDAAKRRIWVVDLNTFPNQRPQDFFILPSQASSKLPADKKQNNNHAPSTLLVDDKRHMLIALSTDSRMLFFLDAVNGHEIFRVRDLRDKCIDIQWPSDGKRLLVSSASPQGGVGVIPVPNLKSRLIFASDRGRKTYQIHTADSNGDNVIPLLPEPSHAQDVMPRWSPDGQRIAFLSNRGIKPHIYIVNHDGTGLTELEKTRPSMRKEDGRSIDWSPDGRQIVYVDENLASLDLVDITSGNITVLVVKFPPPYEQPNHVCWAPNGDIVLTLHRRNSGADCELFRVDPHSGAVAKITTSDQDDGLNHFSPTVNRKGQIACLRVYKSKGSDSNAFLFMKNEGMDSAKIRLTEKDDPIQHLKFPRWVPDGRKILFSANSPDDAYQHLFILDVNTHTTQQLTDGGWNDIHPDMSIPTLFERSD